MSTHAFNQRSAGILLHPTSLPSGKSDDTVFAWLDWLHKAGFKVWQFLPLGVPLANLSPYQCASAFACNPALLPTPTTAIDNKDFQQWQQLQQHWLPDYSLFMVLKQHHGGIAWSEWQEPYKRRDEQALHEFRHQHHQACLSIEQEQYRLAKRWHEVHDYAKAKGIQLFGDMPIFVAYDSADVWANQSLFRLNDQGQPTVVAGVPPDYFSETGQRWGNPHYDWNAMQADGFAWWLQRLQHHLDWFDMVRIDHFRGLEAVWIINADCETAIDGYWEKTPGDALLQQLQDQMGTNLPLVAEDLGIITPEVTALRDKYQLPGMAVLQFSFDHFDDNPHKPKNMPANCIAYTGTHDNDTTQGWLNSLSEGERHHVMHQLQIGDESQALNAMIDTIMHCNANLAIFPLQDLLGLGSEARMNTPGVAENNWQWQLTVHQLTDSLAHSLQQRITDAGRH